MNRSPLRLCVSISFNSCIMHEFPSFHAERLRSGAPIRGPRRRTPSCLLQVADKSCKAARAGPRTSGNQKRCKSPALGPCRNSECDSYAVAWPPRLASFACAREREGGVGWGGGEEYIQIRRAEIRIRIGGVSSDTCLRIGDDH